jgi:hypothetical protein
MSVCFESTWAFSLMLTMQLEHCQLLFIYAPCCLFAWAHYLGWPNYYWMCHVRIWTLPLTRMFPLHTKTQSCYDAQALPAREWIVGLFFNASSGLLPMPHLCTHELSPTSKCKHSTKQVHVVRLGFKF